MHSASQREAGQRDALDCMLVTEVTSQLDRSALKEDSGERSLMPINIDSMLVTVLTSQFDRSALKRLAH